MDALELTLGKVVNATAGHAASITGFQDFTQFCQCESDSKRPLHYQHSLQSARRIDSVTGLCSLRRLENTNPFIVSNRIWAQPCRLGQSAGAKSFGTAVLHHEKYQPWNAFQSQGLFRAGGPRTISSNPGHDTSASVMHVGHIVETAQFGRMIEWV